ncbi:hypothetical protein HHK36_029705 [Tetracentron sinense]|uniref:glutathione transferase n=1 Tax=Tetracentron sinense TaxID=13715 RepID=A0A834YA26_TETSI|nr:hypothetical protein HHK36_029705 [Tetracentron sinense]
MATTTSDVKLLGSWASPFVMRAQIAFNIKSVSYELLEETLYGPKSQLFLQSNPIHKKMPVLIHADKPICESLIIVQYIDDVWTNGPTILPSDPYDRAIARFWAAYIDDKCFASIQDIARGLLEGEAKKAAIEQMSLGLILLEEAFEKCSKGKGYFGGEKIGYIDIALGSLLGWIKVMEKMLGVKLIYEAKAPGLVGWAERFCEDSAVKEVMPEIEKLEEVAKLLHAMFKAPPNSSHRLFIALYPRTGYRDYRPSLNTRNQICIRDCVCDQSAMATSDVKLLGSWVSPFVMRAQIAFNIKSVSYEFLQETLDGSKSQLLLQSNPIHKKIPVLIHADKPICESLIIVQYIDEVWTNGPNILPSDPYDRAIARFWAAYIDDKCFASFLEIARGLLEGEAKKAAIEQMSSGLILLEEAFEKCSKGKGYFGGEKIGYIDIALGSFLGWIKVIEKMLGVKLIYEAKTPGLVGWAERFCEDSAVKEVMPEIEKLEEVAKLLQAKYKGSS